MTLNRENEPETADRGRPPFSAAKRAAVAQVVAIAAGLLTMVSGLLMWRILGYTAANLSTGVSFVPSSSTDWSTQLAVGPGGAGALLAVVGLALRGRARWLRYLQIGLGLLALASSAYIADVCAPFIGLAPLFWPLAVADISGVAAIVQLTRTLSPRRSAGRRLRWQHAFVLLMAAVPGVAIAVAADPTGAGILTGLVSRCPRSTDNAPTVTVTVQNQAGQTVAAQRLAFTTSGARYRLRLPTGTYSITASAGGASEGDTIYVPANQADEEDFDDPANATCVG